MNEPGKGHFKLDTWMLRAEIRSRSQFGRLLRSKPYRSRAVEVGTHQGEFAAEFLSGWRGSKLFCIDSWLQGYDDKDPASHGDRSKDYQKALSRLCGFKSRVEIIEEFSNVAVHRFKNNSLEFVYVDACHQFRSVLEDLYIWWEKVKSGGILAGHDIVCPGAVNGGWSQFVLPAVIEFGDSIGLPFYLIVEHDGQPWSYYFRKL